MVGNNFLLTDDLDLPAKDDDAHHQGKVEQVDGEEIFPLEFEQVVDAQSGECPFKPYDYK